MAKLMKKAQDGMALQRKKDERERMKVRKDTTSSPSKEVKKSMAEGAMEAKSVPKKKMGGVIKKAQMGGRLKSSMNNLPPKSTGTTGYMVPAPKPKKADKPSGYETLPYKKDKPMMKQKMGGTMSKKK
jgi:hypothetical protein